MPRGPIFLFGSLFLVLGYLRTIVFRMPADVCVLKISCVSNVGFRDCAARSFVNVTFVVPVCFMFVRLLFA